MKSPEYKEAGNGWEVSHEKTAYSKGVLTQTGDIYRWIDRKQENS